MSNHFEFSSVQGVDCGEEISLWLSQALELDDCRLLRQFQNRKNDSGNILSCFFLPIILFNA